MQKEEEGNVCAYTPDDATLRLSPEAATILLERMALADARIAAMSAEDDAVYQTEQHEQGARALAQIQPSPPQKRRRLP
ncbi:MAG TPA: hypothetical protein VFW96_15350 [Thermomicrobiales bacterium]|nr:hypothetical protein [Thermomicrobiales bacterium]